MYTCKQATELLSLSQDHKLTLRQKIGMHLHLSMCKLCSRHKKQMAFLQQVLDLSKKHPDTVHHSTSLSETKKEEIKKCIREHTDS